MRENINTSDYWNRRFSSGHWEAKCGRQQTENFARGQMPHIRLHRDFAGILLDFGCGLGDAMPVYRQRFPKASLLGVDISDAAIDICKQKFGSFATFISGDFECVPEVDVIITSNVLEHLSDDRKVVSHLLSKCKELYVVVPYKEFPLSSEHVNTYEEKSFVDIGKHDYKVFPCKGWSQYGLRERWFNLHFKNLFRPIFAKPRLSRNLQIIFHFKNAPDQPDIMQRNSTAKKPRRIKERSW